MQKAAAQVGDVLMNAHAKLKKKNADMIVANQVGDGLAQSVSSCAA